MHSVPCIPSYRVAHPLPSNPLAMDPRFQAQVLQKFYEDLQKQAQL